MMKTGGWFANILKKGSRKVITSSNDSIISEKITTTVLFVISVKDS